MAALALPDTVTFRAYREEDYPLVFAITRETMRHYMEESLGPWVDEEEYESIRDKLKPDCCHLLLKGSREIGLVVIDRHPFYITLEWLFLLPEAQRQGIGSMLLKNLQEEARAKNLPLKLHVLTFTRNHKIRYGGLYYPFKPGKTLLISNPARFWYQREGFVITKMTPQRWFMEYKHNIWIRFLYTPQLIDIKSG